MLERLWAAKPSRSEWGQAAKDRNSIEYLAPCYTMVMRIWRTERKRIDH
jgi:hypothetical protein